MQMFLRDRRRMLVVKMFIQDLTHSVTRANEKPKHKTIQLSVKFGCARGRRHTGAQVVFTSAHQKRSAVV
ncbi:hypothetical protein T265_00881 [Opisthorchis viverrini]|uniref:Uncharacterized protein n=1 Tax=Opisthorchis viverrini TaxID=6198 RepID=A0A075A0I4_OPIVI|nr:hypothetical protein T265_00881 [Opisthorchis viverrini]KER33183.1 hypothetical protein T265_00881 [Opisthorchis viverrini]